MTKLLIFIRHGHRFYGEREEDNGLSEKGKKQAKDIAHFFKERFSEQAFEIRTSPKRRCMETVKPLSEKLDQEVIIEDGLDEQKPNESSAQFRSRLKQFLSRLVRTGPGIKVLCSHGDVVPTAVEMLTHQSIELQKGGWVEIRVQEGAEASSDIQWMIQSFKFF